MEPTGDETDDTRPPSKSQRKRDAHAAQALGERLVALRSTELTGLPLDDLLRDAIEAAREITSRGARARQLQYIGKLMRAANMGAIEATLAARAEAHNARARLKR
jgi:ribosome-associated protein